MLSFVRQTEVPRSSPLPRARSIYGEIAHVSLTEEINNCQVTQTDESQRQHVESIFGCKQENLSEAGEGRAQAMHVSSSRSRRHASRATRSGDDRPTSALGLKRWTHEHIGVNVSSSSSEDTTGTDPTKHELFAARVARRTLGSLKDGNASIETRCWTVTLCPPVSILVSDANPISLAAVSPRPPTYLLGPSAADTSPVLTNT